MSEQKPARKRFARKRLKIILGVYFLLLVFSGVVRFFETDSPFPAEKKQVTVAEVENDIVSNRGIRFAYREFAPTQASNAPPIFLIHGSPGDGDVMMGLAKSLSRDRRVIIPDLPGFGDSTIDVADYSFRAHAHYILELAEKLNIERFDVLGFSMGGGVALNVYDIGPGKVRSVELVSSIGVQEYELLGDYNLNHLLHGVQLASFYIIREGIPHFGAIGNESISYARNFYDSDQRNLRGILSKIDVPVLIVHGTLDPLVPVGAAREHARLVPQSEFFELERENHFTAFMHPETISPIIGNFLSEVDNLQAKDRTSADAARRLEADKPFQLIVSEAQGITAFVYFLLISLATLVSEDLAAIGAGVLAADGRISLTLAITASFFGIYVGDLLLFLAGRWFGTKALRRVPVRWFVNENSVNKAAVWFEKRGTMAILLSRFTPSFRLPTYFSAGMFGMSFLKFAVASGVAVAIWTPVLVVLAACLGAETIAPLFTESQSAIWKIILVLFAFYLSARFLIKLMKWKGRRLFVGKIKRIIKWEFWPVQIFYIPVVVYVFALAIKHRSLTVFTCANPAILAGGFVGESKNEIYEIMRRSADAMPFLLSHGLIRREKNGESQLKAARNFMTENGLNFPVALKPDKGERGKGVAIIRSENELKKHIERADSDLIVQEYFGGDEASVFYCRFPKQEKGNIFSITEKRFPAVVGDGKSNLEQLILNDSRAVCLAEKYLEKNANRLSFIPAAGEEVRITDIGTHSRGAIFLEGDWLKSEALEQKINEICRGFEGFFFGRFDIRAASFAELRKGEGFRIIELNGVTSESTNIYDPQYSLFNAYGILFRQWRIAFEIGSANRELGAEPTSVSELLGLLFFDAAKAGLSVQLKDRMATAANNH